jgi:L-malate glycosyltransferase
MRIAIYVPSWPAKSAANGIVTYGAQMVPALRRRGHDVFVITPYRSSNEKDDSTIDLSSYHRDWSFLERLTSRIVPNGVGFYKATQALASAVRDLVDRYDIELVEIEESFGWSYAISRLHLVPVVVRLHGPWFMTGRFRNAVPTSADINREKYEKRGIESADAVSAPSNYVLQSVKKQFGSSRIEGVVYSNPIEAVRPEQKWKLDDCDRNTLLFVGRFDELKGADLIIKAFAELAGLYPKLNLTFVGPNNGVRGPDGKSLLFEGYTRTFLSEDVLSRVKYKGKITHSDVATLRATHFVTLCASRTEMLPYSVLEAMSFGCPVVASAVGGIPEMIQSGQNGLLFPSQDVPGLVNACRELLEHPSLAARLGEQAWRDCRERYRPDDLAEQAVGMYRQTIERFNYDRGKIARPRAHRSAVNSTRSQAP